MAIDAVESTSPSPSSPSSSQQRHFYVAVDRLQYKMVTLLDLLGTARHRPGLPMVVTCSSRDELDSVCSAVSSLPFISLSCLYSDLSEADRVSVLEKFQEETIRWKQKVRAESGEDSDTEKDEQKSHMIVVTDACLPILSSGESPLSAHVLINYELTIKKPLIKIVLNLPSLGHRHSQTDSQLLDKSPKPPSPTWSYPVLGIQQILCPACHSNFNSPTYKIFVPPQNCLFLHIAL